MGDFLEMHFKCIRRTKKYQCLNAIPEKIKQINGHHGRKPFKTC